MYVRMYVLYMYVCMYVYVHEYPDLGMTVKTRLRTYVVFFLVS